jgi:rod shape-determining protein MreC
MPRKDAAKRRLIIAGLIVVSLVLITLFFREPIGGMLHSAQRGGVGALSPLQSAATKAVEPFENGWRWIKGLWSANSENQKMSRELEELRSLLVEFQEAKYENERLKELLELRDSGVFPEGCEFIAARVIGKSPTRWRLWVQIDKGAADGVRLNQPVVGATVSADRSLSGKGLVGKVIAVTTNSAQVQLITDPQSSVAALVQSTRAEGIVEGTVSGSTIMDYVERDQLVEPKQVVITSGFGGLYPKGIPVGVVMSVGEEDVNIYKQIEVQPFVNFLTLEEVLVITMPLPEGEGSQVYETVSPWEENGQGGGR